LRISAIALRICASALSSYNIPPLYDIQESHPPKAEELKRMHQGLLLPDLLASLGALCAFAVIVSPRTPMPGQTKEVVRGTRAGDP
jgi:hypothetical protein